MIMPTTAGKTESILSRGSFLIAEMPDCERPRERLELHGVEALSDAELLAILIRTGRFGRSALDVARDLLVAFGGKLDRITDASLEELRSVRGIGPAKAIEISAALALASRIGPGRRLRRQRLLSPAAAALAVRDQFHGKKQEEFHVLLLDQKSRLIADRVITRGLVDKTPVHPREIFRPAIRESCSRIILVHNHPSGDPTPSRQDIAATRVLKEAGDLLGITVIDHLIIGAESASYPMGYLSMKEEKIAFETG